MFVTMNFSAASHEICKNHTLLDDILSDHKRYKNVKFAAAL